MSVFIEYFVDFVLRVIAALVIITAIRNPLQLALGPRVIGTILVLAIIAAYLIYRRLKQQRVVTPASSAERTYIDIKPKFLMKLYRKHPPLQADKLSAPYRGHWMRVRGFLYKIEHRNYIVSAYIYAEGFLIWAKPHPYIHIRFRNPSPSGYRYLQWELGNSITVDGKLDSVDAQSIRLKDCELV